MSVQEEPDCFFEGLTIKQREALDLLAENRTSKEIAGSLDVSESAINQRIDTLRQRLGGVSRAELARRYRSSLQGGEPEKTCENLTGENLHLASGKEASLSGRRHGPPGRFHFANSQVFGQGQFVDGAATAGRPQVARR